MAAPLGAFLLAYSLQLAVVVSVLWAVLRVLASRSAAVRLRTWQAALVGAMVLPVGAFVPLSPMSSSAGADALLSIAMVSIEPVNAAARQTAWTPWLLTLMALGAALRIVWIGTGWVMLRYRFPTAPSADDPRFAEACETVGAHARLVWRNDVSHPFTYGMAPPVIVVPGDLASAPDTVLRAIFTHELMHVTRRDWQSVIVEEAIRALLWFHPAIWLLLAELRQAREEVIDRAVVRLIGSRRTYLETLVALADRNAPNGFTPALPFFRSRQLARRIAAMASEVSMSRLRIALTCLAVFALSMMTIGAAATAFPLPSMTGTTLLQASQQSPGVGAAPGPIEQSAVDVSADAPPPARTRFVAPELPRDAVTMGHPEFHVRLVVDAQGKVAEARMVDLGAQHVDVPATLKTVDAVLGAVRQWEFERPQRAPLAFTVVLTLDPVAEGGTAPSLERPVVIEMKKAEYPESAKAKKIQGDVAVEATIDAQGTVAETRVVKTLAPELDEAAAAAIRASTFRPGMKDGKPVPVKLTITVRFTLK
jgi:TonB family protein